MWQRVFFIARISQSFWWSRCPFPFLMHSTRWYLMFLLACLIWPLVCGWCGVKWTSSIINGMSNFFTFDFKNQNKLTFYVVASIHVFQFWLDELATIVSLDDWRWALLLNIQFIKIHYLCTFFRIENVPPEHFWCSINDKEGHVFALLDFTTLLFIVLIGPSKINLLVLH